MYKSKYFKPHELVDPVTYESCQNDIYRLFDESLLIALDWIKENIAKEKRMIVNNWKFATKGEIVFKWRGIRTLCYEKFNKYSMHALQSGKVKAIDFHIEGFSAERVRQLILDNEGNKNLVGIKRMEEGVNWVHIDSKITDKKNPTGRRIYLFKA